MPREDCTLVTGKPFHPFLAHQRRSLVSGSRRFAYSFLLDGNERGVKPDFSISISQVTGAMVGLIAFAAVLSAYNNLCPSLHSLSDPLGNYHQYIMRSQIAYSQCFTKHWQDRFTHTLTFYQNY